MVISFGKRVENLDVAIQKGTIGSDLSTFRDYIASDSILFLHCKGSILATAHVSGPYQFSKSEIWTNKTYPHRFPVRISRFLSSPVQLCDGVLNVELKKRFGTGWAYKFLFSPKPVPADIGRKLLAVIERIPSTTAEQFHQVLTKL